MSTRAQCASCQSENLTPVTEHQHGPTRVRFGVTDAKGGWLDASDETFSATRARICLACGYVMPMLGARDLERLRQRASHLVAVAES